MAATQALQTFIIYAKDDFEHKQQLVLHLRPLIQNQIITLWHDGNILPGEAWEEKIFEALSSSNLVLMLVSKSSLNSDFIQNKELKATLAQKEKGQTRLIPIIVSHCHWEMDRILKDLQALPDKNGRILPVTDAGWQSTDEAWTVVCKKIAELIASAQEQHPKILETATSGQASSKASNPKSHSSTSNNAALKKFLSLSALLLCLVAGVFFTIKNISPTANKNPDKEIIAQHQNPVPEKQKEETPDVIEKTQDIEVPSTRAKDGDAKTKGQTHNPPKISDKTQQNISVNNNPPKSQLSPSSSDTLTLSALTNKGTKNIHFKTGETIRLFTQVNKACTLRILYMLADGQMVLLEKDRVVNPTEINKKIEIGDGYEVAAPYGKEIFTILASTKDFKELDTIVEDGYTKILEPAKTLRKIRGIKPKIYFQQVSIDIETEE